MDKQEKIAKILNRLKNLRQYKNKSEEELLEIARKRYQEELVDLSSVAITPEEKKLAKKLLSKYLSESDIASFADRSDLAKLIDLEIIHMRFQAQLNESYDEEDDDGKPMAVPLKLIESMHNNIQEMSTLKQKLGLVKDEKEKVDPLKVINQLKARFKKYINEHKDDFTMRCPFCARTVLLRRRTKDYIAKKHPFLRNNLLYNEELLTLVVRGKITHKEASEVLETSEDYIKWVIKKHYKKNE